MTDKKQQARDAHEYRQQQLLAKLDELKALAAETPEDVDWGHVGSLQLVETKIDEALQHLGY